VLSVSLGTSIFLGREKHKVGSRTLEFRSIKKVHINIAHRILGTFVSCMPLVNRNSSFNSDAIERKAKQNKSQSSSAEISQQAKENCESLMEYSKVATDRMKEHFGK